MSKRKASVSNRVGAAQVTVQSQPSEALTPSSEKSLPLRPASAVERTSKREAERLRRQKERRNRTLLFSSIGVVAVVIIGFLIYRQVTHVEPGEFVPQEGQTGVHVTEGSAIAYLHTPPSSGPHYPSPLAWNIFPTEQPEGNWVHNLEHGGVVMLYNCPSGCDDTIARMRAFYNKQPLDKWEEVKLVMMPYARLPKGDQVDLVAWNRILHLSQFDETKAQQFYNAYVDQGPEDTP